MNACSALNAALADFERPRPRPLRRQEIAWRQTTPTLRLPLADGLGCWRQLGAPQQPKALLLHGWGGDAASYAPLARALTAAGWQAIIPDLLGHGDARGEAYGYAAQLRWLGALQRRLGPFALIIAHSAGAVLVEAALAAGILQAEARVLLAAPVTLVSLFQRYLQQTRQRLFSAPQLAAAYLDAQRLSRALLDPAHHSAGGKLLICHGAQDRIIAPHEADRLAAVLPHARQWRPADTGHMGLLQHAGLFHQIADFYPLPGRKATDAIYA